MTDATHRWTAFVGYHLSEEEASQFGLANGERFSDVIAKFEPCFIHTGMGCIVCGERYQEVHDKPCAGPNGAERIQNEAKIHFDAREGLLPPELADLAEQLASLGALRRAVQRVMGEDGPLTDEKPAAKPKAKKMPIVVPPSDHLH